MAKGEFMKKKSAERVVQNVETSPTAGCTKLKVRRGYVDSISIYEIKEEELDTLERGVYTDIQLNFAIFLLSSALTAAATLASANFNSRIWEVVFAFIFIGGLIGAIVLFAIWRSARKPIKRMIEKIRGRIPQAPNNQAKDHETYAPNGENDR